MDDPRFDYVFSYWIFIWFIGYKLHIIPYNPKLFLSIALLENLFYLWLMFYYHNSSLYILLFVLLNVVIKVLPLLLLWNTPTISKIQDILFGLFLILFYFIWLVINKVNIIQSLFSSYNGIKNNKPVTPFIYYVSKLF